MLSDNGDHREEMMTFSAQMHRMAERKLPFERLVVDASLALKIFQVKGKGPYKVKNEGTS